MNILFLSHSFWGSDFRVGSHHLSKNMARSGHRVLYVSMPVTPFHLLKYKISDYRIKRSGIVSEIEDRLFQYIPRLLFPVGRIFFGEKDISLLAFNLQRISDHLGMKQFDVVLLDEPRLYGMLGGIKFRKIVYRPTDIKTGIDFKSYFNLEDKITKAADGVIATSVPVMESLEKFFTLKSPRYVQENGVDLEHFKSNVESIKEISNLPGRKCIYVGAFDERFDFDAVKVLVKNAPDISFFFIGPGGGRIKSIDLKNCKYLGAVSFDEIPRYLRACDVAIMPFSSNPSNNGRSPMKLYEYLAAGLPVVARRTQEISRRNLERVFLYDNPEEAIKQVQAASQLKKFSQVPKELDWSVISERMIRFCNEI